MQHFTCAGLAQPFFLHVDESNVFFNFSLSSVD